MKFNQETSNLVMFVGTLISIVLLSKIGGSGSDLAIMTGLIGVLGMIVGQKRSSSTPAGTPGDPINTKEAGNELR